MYDQINLLLGHGSVLTHPSGPLHRLVRKGIAPAFSTQNIRHLRPYRCCLLRVHVLLLEMGFSCSMQHHDASYLCTLACSIRSAAASVTCHLLMSAGPAKSCTPVTVALRRKHELSSLSTCRTSFPDVVEVARLVIDMLKTNGLVSLPFASRVFGLSQVTERRFECRAWQYGTYHGQAGYPLLRRRPSLYHLHRGGAQDSAVDMDNVLQRQSMDVIGRVAFGKHLGAMRSLKDGSRGVNRAMDSIVRGAHGGAPSPKCMPCPGTGMLSPRRCPALANQHALLCRCETCDVCRWLSTAVQVWTRSRAGCSTRCGATCSGTRCSQRSACQASVDADRASAQLTNCGRMGSPQLACLDGGHLRLSNWAGVLYLCVHVRS